MAPLLMKTRTQTLLVWIGLGFLLAGCGGRDNGETEAPIKGRPSDPPVALRAEWKPDRRYLLRVEAQQTLELPFPPGSRTAQDTLIQQDYSVTVTNAEAGRKGLELEVAALAVQAHFGDQVVLRFDSMNPAVPNEGPGVDVLQRVVGGKIRFLLGPDGQVEKTSGLEELLGQNPNGGNRGPAWRGNLMGGGLQRLYGEDYLKQIVEVGALPPGPVRVGDTWTRRRELEVGLVGRVAAVTTNTFRGWQVREGRSCARIDFAGTLTLKTNIASGGLPLSGLSLEEGRVSGKAWFEPSLGLPLAAEMEQSCRIAGTLPNLGRRGPAGVQGTNAGPLSFSTPWRQSVTLAITVASNAPSAPPR